MKALNVQKMGKARQSGFTIIELVVVILLLGILTATALPRFIDVSDEAHNAVVDAVEGGINTSYALYHAEYIAENDNNATVGNSGVTASTGTGYPSQTSNSECNTALDNLLQVGHPSAAAGSSATPANLAAIPTDLTGDPSTTDIISWHLTADDSCAWVYHADEPDKTDITGAKVVLMTTGGAVSRSVLP